MALSPLKTGVGGVASGVVRLLNSTVNVCLVYGIDETCARELEVMEEGVSGSSLSVQSACSLCSVTRPVLYEYIHTLRTCINIRIHTCTHNRISTLATMPCSNAR